MWFRAGGASLACGLLVCVGADAEAQGAIEIEAPSAAQVATGASDLAFVAGRVAWFGPERDALDLALAIDVSDSTDEPSLSSPPPPLAWWRRALAWLGRTPPIDPAHTLLGDELRTASALLFELDPATTRVAVVAFAGGFRRSASDSWTEVPLTNDFGAVRAALSRLLRRGSGGLTRPSAAVDRALVELLGTRSGGAPARAHARRAVALLTDARGPWETASPAGELEPALRRAQLAGVRLDVFAFGEEARRPDTPARAWAADTGGSWLDAGESTRARDAFAALRYSEVEAVLVSNRTNGASADPVAIDPDGGFSCLLALAPGPNQVEIVARLSDGSSLARSLELVRAADGSTPELPARLLGKRRRLLAERLHAPVDRRSVAVSTEVPAAPDPGADGEATRSRMMSP